MNLGNIYADIPEFRNPSILTGDVYRPDLLLVTPDKSLYIRKIISMAIRSTYYIFAAGTRIGLGLDCLTRKTYYFVNISCMYL